jgi:hypothetical protein
MNDKPCHPVCSEASFMWSLEGNNFCPVSRGLLFCRVKSQWEEKQPKQTERKHT